MLKYKKNNVNTIMKEYFTSAIVLDEENSGEVDKLIYLYTKELGRVTAKAKSIRKITSKLAGHLQPFNFVNVRLVEKNGFQIVDALLVAKIKKSKDLLARLQFIKEITFDIQPDKRFWHAIKKTVQDFEKNKKISYKNLLEVLGFATDFARCNNCDIRTVSHFHKKEQLFFCRRCALKIPADEIILI